MEYSTSTLSSGNWYTAQTYRNYQLSWVNNLTSIKIEPIWILCTTSTLHLHSDCYQCKINVYKCIVIPTKSCSYRLHEQTAIVQIPNTVQSDYLLCLPCPSNRHQVRGDETRLSISSYRGDCGMY